MRNVDNLGINRAQRSLSLGKTSDTEKTVCAAFWELGTVRRRTFDEVSI